MSQFSDQLYERLAPLAYRDEEFGWPLHNYVRAASKMFEEVELYGRFAHEPVPAASPILDTFTHSNIDPAPGWVGPNSAEIVGNAAKPSNNTYCETALPAEYVGDATAFCTYKTLTTDPAAGIDVLLHIKDPDVISNDECYDLYVSDGQWSVVRYLPPGERPPDYDVLWTGTPTPPVAGERFYLRTRGDYVEAWRQLPNAEPVLVCNVLDGKLRRGSIGFVIDGAGGFVDDFGGGPSENSSDPGFLPWTIILDIERAPNEAAVRWLSQLHGVRLPQSGLTLEQLKQRIRDAEARRRGTVPYLVAVAQRYLTGTKAVAVTERYNSAYGLRIVTQPAETPDSAALLKGLLENKPAGITLYLNSVAAAQWNQATSTWNATGLTWSQSSSAIP